MPNSLREKVTSLSLLLGKGVKPATYIERIKLVTDAMPSLNFLRFIVLDCVGIEARLESLDPN